MGTRCRPHHPASWRACRGHALKISQRRRRLGDGGSPWEEDRPISRGRPRGRQVGGLGSREGQRGSRGARRAGGAAPTPLAEAAGDPPGAGARVASRSALSGLVRAPARFVGAPLGGLWRRRRILVNTLLLEPDQRGFADGGGVAAGGAVSVFVGSIFLVSVIAASDARIRRGPERWPPRGAGAPLPPDSGRGVLVVDVDAPVDAAVVVAETPRSSMRWLGQAAEADVLHSWRECVSRFDEGDTLGPLSRQGAGVRRVQVTEGRATGSLAIGKNPPRLREAHSSDATAQVRTANPARTGRAVDRRGIRLGEVRPAPDINVVWEDSAGHAGLTVGTILCEQITALHAVPRNARTIVYAIPTVGRAFG